MPRTQLCAQLSWRDASRDADRRTAHAWSAEQTFVREPDGAGSRTWSQTIEPADEQEAATDTAVADRRRGGAGLTVMPHADSVTELRQVGGAALLVELAGQ